LTFELTRLHQQQLVATHSKTRQAELEQAYRARMLEIAQLEYDNARKTAELLTRYEKDAARINNHVHASEYQPSTSEPPLAPIIKKTRLHEPARTRNRGRTNQPRQESSDASTEGSSYESALDTDELASDDEHADDFVSPRQTILLHAPVFSVVKSKDDDMIEWFRRFELKSKAQGWSEKVMATQAPLNFEEEAECIWDCLTTQQKGDYATMKRLMIKGMKKPGSEAATQNEYHSLRQEQGETPAQLCMRLKRLVQRSSSLKQLPESDIARKFVSALHYDICSSLLNRKFRKVDAALKQAEVIDNRRARAERDRSLDFSINAVATKVKFNDSVQEIQARAATPPNQQANATPSIGMQTNRSSTPDFVASTHPMYRQPQPQYLPMPTNIDPQYSRYQHANYSYQPPGYPQQNINPFNAQYGPDMQQRRGSQRTKVSERGCFKCGEADHWKRDCPRQYRQHQTQLNVQASQMEMQRPGQ